MKWLSDVMCRRASETQGLKCLLHRVYCALGGGEFNMEVVCARNPTANSRTCTLTTIPKPQTVETVEPPNPAEPRSEEQTLKALGFGSLGPQCLGFGLAASKTLNPKP